MALISRFPTVDSVAPTGPLSVARDGSRHTSRKIDQVRLCSLHSETVEMDTFPGHSKGNALADDRNEIN